MCHENYYRIILDTIPSPIFVVAPDVRIVDFNAAAALMLGEDRKLIIRRRAGEVLHCVHSTETHEGCGKAPFCHECIIRNSVDQSFMGNKLVRRRVRMEIVRAGKVAEAYLSVTTSPLNLTEESLVLIILEDLNEIMELRSILPICSSCRKIRDDQKYWRSLESYFKKSLDINFSHGICPECAKRLYPDLVK